MNASGPMTRYHLYNTLYSLSYLINLFASTTFTLFGLSASWFSLFLSFHHTPFPSSKNNQSYDHTYKTAMHILDIKFFPVTSKALSLMFSSLAHSLLKKHGRASVHYSPYHSIIQLWLHHPLIVCKFVSQASNEIFICSLSCLTSFLLPDTVSCNHIHPCLEIHFIHWPEYLLIGTPETRIDLIPTLFAGFLQNHYHKSNLKD